MHYSVLNTSERAQFYLGSATIKERLTAVDLELSTAKSMTY